MLRTIENRYVVSIYTERGFECQISFDFLSEAVKHFITRSAEEATRLVAFVGASYLELTDYQDMSVLKAMRLTSANNKIPNS